MSVDQVVDVDVIAYGRSVRGWEVGAEERERLSPPGRGVERTWDEVRFRAVVLADVTGRTGDVEIAECRVGETIRFRIRCDGTLCGELRGTVGIDRLQRRILGNGNLLWGAVDRGRRRKDDGWHAGVSHCVQHIERAAGVDPPIRCGITHRFRRDGERREME